MRISIDEQAVWDFDWFAVDADGYLVHFASCSGLLPESVSSSKENLAALTQFFSELPELSANEKTLLTDAAIGDSSSFLNYVRQGFYSFDKMVLNSPFDPFYQLMAQPTRPLVLADLPAEIADIINQTRLPYSVTNLSIIDVTTIN